MTWTSSPHGKLFSIGFVWRERLLKLCQMPLALITQSSPSLLSKCYKTNKPRPSTGYASIMPFSATLTVQFIGDKNVQSLMQF